MFLDSLEMNEAKTQAYLTVLKNLKVDDKKTLVVLPSQSDSIYKSSRNLKGHQVRVAGDLNTYDILNCKNLIFVGNAHEIVQDMLK